MSFPAENFKTATDLNSIKSHCVNSSKRASLDDDRCLASRASFSAQLISALPYPLGFLEGWLHESIRAYFGRRPFHVAVVLRLLVLAFAGHIMSARSAHHGAPALIEKLLIFPILNASYTTMPEVKWMSAQR